MADIPIRCSCGGFQAQLENAGRHHGNRVICYCASCQEFARYLGKADSVLDQHGGSDIYQASPGRLKILHGEENLACVHLTEKPTLRWFADCCKSPIGNTLASNKLPFIGLLHTCLVIPEGFAGLDDLVGPVRARVNGNDAKGEGSGVAAGEKMPLSVYWHFGKLVLGAKLSGEYKKSPLFDSETGRPVVKPLRRQPPFQPGRHGLREEDQ